MRTRRGGRRRTVLLAACLVALAFLPVSAQATPGSGVTANLLASGSSRETIAARNNGPTDVVMREITIAPGGTTGWHYHAGQLIAVVRSGTLTRTLSDCSVEVSRAGDTFVEPAGRHRVHTGRNLGTEPVVLYVTYVLPAGSALSEDAAEPGCGEADAG